MSTTAAMRRGKSRAKDESAGALARVGLIALLAAWGFVSAAMVSYSAADAPSLGVWPPSETVSNWCGPVGAFVAHRAITLLGPGAWLLMAGTGTLLALAAAGRPASQTSFRLMGLLMMAGAVSSGAAILFPEASGAPQGAGGLVGIAVGDMLAQRFGAFGGTIWILLMGGIGAIVALDRWLIDWPIAALRAASPHVARASVFLGVRAGSAMARGVRVGAGAAADRLRSRAESRGSSDAVAVARERRTPAAPPRPRRTDVDEGFETEPATIGAPDPAGVDAALEPSDEDAEQDREFDPEALREKIARLPVRFAATKRREAMADSEPSINAEIEAEEQGYIFPGQDILEDPEDNYSEQMEAFVREQASALEAALQQYHIKGEVVGVDSGPVITLYEVRLAPGTKVSALTAVSSDLARALKAVNIRVVANMAGKDTVGVEVPNLKKERVRLKELLRLAKRRGDFDKLRLPMFLGKDASGEALIEDLTSMPHMLIAGTTGSGKSVCINSVILSFAYTKRPSELKLILIDPKMVEMAQFKDIPHLMCPVVTEMPKAAAILEWAVTKMDERYELLSEAGVRDVAAYNGLPWEEIRARMAPANDAEAARIPRRLPYIVFVIDELADLIMTHKEVEGLIVRLAQKARAVGIHLVLATQRPQANVVTGLIKSNMPGRVAFKVASGMDSRIVLDQKGAELLLGAGDMLFLSPRSHKLVRAQGTLVEDLEIRRVVKHLREVAAPSFERQLVQIRSDGNVEPERDGFTAAQEDPMFDKAVEVVLETKRGSVSLLQRRLAIGYTRASRLIDLMGEAGIIGGYKGTVAREVVITPEEWDAMKQQAEIDAAAAQAGEAGGATALLEDDDAAAPADSLFEVEVKSAPAPTAGFPGRKPDDVEEVEEEDDEEEDDDSDDEDDDDGEEGDAEDEDEEWEDEEGDDDEEEDEDEEFEDEEESDDEDEFEDDDEEWEDEDDEGDEEEYEDDDDEEGDDEEDEEEVEPELSVRAPATAAPKTG